MNAREIIVLCDEIVCLDHEVILRITQHGVARNAESATLIAWVTLVHDLHLLCVVERNRIEDGLEIMVTVGSFLNDVETKIDFATRKIYHSKKTNFMQKYSFNFEDANILRNFATLTLQKY